MIWFFVGLFVGFWVGVIYAAWLKSMSRAADERRRPLVSEWRERIR